METIDQRAVLERLIRERGEDYSGLSRLIGRNAAYVQQFIKRGIPKKLDEEDRRTLARYFGISDEALGGPAGVTPVAGAKGRFVSVSRLDVGASAGPGAMVDNEKARASIGFDERWLKELARGSAEQLSIIRVEGDSMEPTLSDGDDIMVDRSDAADRLRDGIYVLRREDVLMVKRLAISPASRVTIKSDNDAYPDWPDCDLGTINIIGRVIWAGRKLR